MTSFPKFPRRIQAPGGPVSVRCVKAPSVNGDTVWGSWEPETRRIEINATISARQQWHTYFHELAHVCFTDSGAHKMLGDKEEELLCEAVATARMRERFG